MPKRKNKKPISDTASFILAFINRNENEQPIPEGYRHVKEWLKILNCTPRTWGRILNGLMKAKKIEYLRLRRVDNKKLKSLNFYKIDEKFLKQALARK